MSSSSRDENTELEARETEGPKTLSEEHETSEKYEECEGAPQTNSQIKETREQKPTEKGRQYQRDILNSKVKASSTKLRQEIEKIKELISSSSTSWETLHRERDTLDQIKDEFNVAHHELQYLLESEEEKEASYQYFDLRDRECMECRIKLAERIYAVEKALSNSKPKSVVSGFSRTSRNSRKTGSSRSSTNSVHSKRIEVVTRKTKLEVEMKFLEQDLEIRRIQLMKDISLATAEDAMKRILEEDNKSIRDQKSITEDKEKENHGDDVKPSKLDPCVPSFIPKGSPNTSLSITQESPEVTNKTEDKRDLGELSAIRELISLQEKQTELSALIANQQMISSLPVQEPPVFSGNILDYPAFMQAFEAIIESKVD